MTINERRTFYEKELELELKRYESLSSEKQIREKLDSLRIIKELEMNLRNLAL